jgi:hypothetical protein
MNAFVPEISAQPTLIMVGSGNIYKPFIDEEE